MVAGRFPGHQMAKLAVIRLANLQYKAGEYKAAIETLRDIMSGSLKELKDEAEYVMATSFEGLIRQLSDRGDLLGVITAYKKDTALINRFENADLFERIGTAFFQTKFFGQAEMIFQKAYKASPPSTRPASLYYRLAVTLQELGQTMQAREMFHQYFQKLFRASHSLSP
jgi:tetratricopeptide (TPR) repeat protein